MQELNPAAFGPDTTVYKRTSGTAAAASFGPDTTVYKRTSGTDAATSFGPATTFFKPDPTVLA
jgi:hypothetical protein